MSKQFFEYTLPNGVRLIAEPIPYFRSVAVGIWVRTGSVNEREEQNGYSHFIEHMLFKGTGRRSAMQISSEIDEIGGQLNAFTSKECTCYYATVRDEHIDIAMDVLSDMFLHSAFDPTEIAKEKGVVIEEIHMVEDTPEDLVHELSSSLYFAGHPLARPILGPEQNIAGLDRAGLVGYFNERYGPEEIVIACAGKIDPERFVALCEQHFGGYKAAPTAVKDKVPPATGDSSEGRYNGRVKDIEQLHFCLALPGVDSESEDLYTLSVLSNILGGGMSSRLFQSLREEHGLVYTIYAYPTVYQAGGKLAIYAALNASQGVKAAQLIEEELNRLKDDLTLEEVAKTKEQLKGNYILGQESTSARMSAIGKGKLMRNFVRTEDQILSLIEQVTLQDVRRLFSQMMESDRRYLSLVGRIEREEQMCKALGINF